MGRCGKRVDIPRCSNVILEIMDSKSSLRIKVKEHNSMRLKNNLLVTIMSTCLSDNLVTVFWKKTVRR